jgi:hypothetical protein
VSPSERVLRPRGAARGTARDGDPQPPPDPGFRVGFAGEPTEGPVVEALPLAAEAVWEPECNDADEVGVTQEATNNGPVSLENRRGLADFFGAVIGSFDVAARTIIHRGLRQPLVARSKAQGFVDALMKAEFEPIAGRQGMSVLRNIPHLEVGKMGNIIVRNMTDAFWEACIRQVNKPGCRVAAVGTRGIGKTTSTPILIRKLLERGNTVVYCLRSRDLSGWYWEFARKGDRYVARAYPEGLLPESIPSLKLSSSYYIVDHGSTTDSCDPPRDFEPKVIIVAALNAEHWGGSRFCSPVSGRRGCFKYYPVWSRAELEEAQAILRPGLAESVVQARFAIFGGVPGNVFADDRVASTLVAVQNTPLVNLKEFDVLKLISTGIVSFSAPGALMGLHVLPENYDNFDVGFSDFISVHVQDKVFREWATRIWNNMIRSHPIHDRIKFERFGRATMTTLTRRQLTLTAKWPGMPELGETEFTLPCCREMAGVQDPVATVTGPEARPLVLYHPRPENFRLIDGAYKDDAGHVYLLQFTAQRTYFIDENNMAQLIRRIAELPTLAVTLCYVVPDCTYNLFETIPAVIEGCPWEVAHVRLANPKFELYWPRS